MKSFWCSFIVFVFMMCSCKTKEVTRSESSYGQVRSDVSALNEQTSVDTTKTKIIKQMEEFTRITETETITEYDKEKGVPSKVTEKKKEYESGIKAKADETENRGVTEAKKDSSNHVIDANKKVETKEEVKEESVAKGMFDNLGKWIGIGICGIIGLALIWRKLKNKLSLCKN